MNDNNKFKDFKDFNTMSEESRDKFLADLGMDVDAINKEAAEETQGVRDFMKSLCEQLMSYKNQHNSIPLARTVICLEAMADFTNGMLKQVEKNPTFFKMPHNTFMLKKLYETQTELGQILKRNGVI